MTALEAAGMPVLIAPGNDDWLGPRMGFTQHTWPSNVTIFNEETFTPYPVTDGLTIWGTAHRRGHGDRSFFHGAQVDRGGMNLALFHAAERSGLDREPLLDPCRAFDEAEIGQAGFDHALVGHYQRHHLGDLHTYPGAPLPHDPALGPTGGVVELELSGDDRVKAEFVPIPTSPLQDVEVDLSGASDDRAVQQRVATAIQVLAGTVRIRLIGIVSIDINIRPHALGELATEADRAFVVTDDLRVETHEEARIDEPTVRGAFIRLVLDAPELPDGQRQRVLEAGLRALDGQDALQVVR